MALQIDPRPHLEAVAQAMTGDNQPAATFAALDAALKQTIGHKLFTVLVVNWERSENQRYYSSNPGAYPVGGAKPINRDSQSARKVIMAGECHINHDYAELSAAFFDHELIRSLGCESSINVPVRWDGQTIGMLNLLHEAHWYDDVNIATLKVFAALAAPALMKIIKDWPKAGPQPDLSQSGSRT
ncbi:GAF domain-containing protein [Terrarubrum flagellatum]|uniref:GAF domain-containing protein n=1 Tax=Terrirubrum flagellatum TaxID=2895980 RepID=UPI0031450097